METFLSDLLDIEQTWCSEHQALVSTLRKFAENEIKPRLRKHHEQGTFPSELIPQMAELGLLEPLAGDGYDPIGYGLAMREIEAASSTLRSFLSVTGSLTMSALRFFGNDSQKAAWLPELASLKKIGCFALTEPDFGSNPSAMRTKAERIEDGYVLSGSKMWITNGTQAHVAIVWAKLDDQVRGFVVELDQPGIERRSIDHKWSFRSSDTAELYFDRTQLRSDALLEGTRSVGSALKCLNEARYGILWGVTGAARSCFEETLAYLKERVQFAGKPLASHQLIQSKLAWMATQITQMQLLSKRLGELKSDGKLTPYQVSTGKMANCRSAIEVARTCRELLGAAGIHDEHETGRHLVDLETVLTYEGTEHIHSLIVGQHLTGIAAYS